MNQHEGNDPRSGSRAASQEAARQTTLTKRLAIAICLLVGVLALVIGDRVLM